MSDRDVTKGRKPAWKSTHAASTLGALRVDHTWLWRKSGLVLSAMIALVVATLSLSAIPREAVVINGLDKAYHFIAYLMLIFPLIVTDSRRWYWAVPLVVLYGGALELVQPTVGRSAEWLDFGANVTGVLAGAALAEILHDRIHRSVFDETALSAEEQAAQDAQRLEAMRSELMEELRVVLREELAAVPQPGPDRPVGPSPAEDAGQKSPVRLAYARQRGGDASG